MGGFCKGGTLQVCPVLKLNLWQSYYLSVFSDKMDIWSEYFTIHIIMKAADLNSPCSHALNDGGWPNVGINWFNSALIIDV